MKNRLLVLIILGILFHSYSCISVQAAEVKRKPLINNSSQPIEITSDRLEAFDEKKMVVFSGNAIVTQGSRVIKAEKILLYYKNESRGATGKSAVKGMGKAGELEKIDAKGHVTVTEGDRVVTGDDAVYYQDAQKIVMTGNAVMHQGKNVVQGDKIEVFLNENRGVVEAPVNKRVKATIYPTEKQEEKK